MAKPKIRTKKDVKEAVSNIPHLMGYHREKEIVYSQTSFRDVQSLNSENVR
jgi:hypothetical protein